MTEDSVPVFPQPYTPAPQLLAGRTVLITGGGGGLGGETAVAAAALGATVILLGPTIPKLEAIYDRIEAAGAPQPAIVPMNLLTATWAQYEQVAETIDREFGRLDGIVHAAALFRSFSRLEDLDPRDWMDSLQVNLTAPYTLTRVMLPLLRKAPDASVVWIADQGGRAARAFQGAYGVTKAAAETLFRTWALELSSEAGLRFNSYYPGPMRTALRTRGYTGEALHESPLPATAVPPLLWLLGPDSRGVSGHAL